MPVEPATPPPRRSPVYYWIYLFVWMTRYAILLVAKIRTEWKVLLGLLLFAFAASREEVLEKSPPVSKEGKESHSDDAAG